MSNIIVPTKVHNSLIQRELKKMKHIKNASLASEINIWRSPIPYLFGGIALLFLLISVALVILICYHRKHVASSVHSSSEGEEGMKGTIMPSKVVIDNNEPKILVIMAGDENPSYLAEPIASLNRCTCDCEANPTTSSSSLINGKITEKQ
ncbi:hypothetical protein S83_071609 [Arachis hypogaea]|nr:Protein GLUTAMINE DUMPER [Arachis hypogaea]